MNNNCWYCTVSETEDTVECGKGQNVEWCDVNCPIYKNVKANFEKSGLPEKYWWPFTLKKTKADAEAIDKILGIKNNLAEFVEGGKNILLQSSKCGNGKTSWGIRLLQKQIELNYKGSLGSWPPAFFVYTPSLLLDARKSISSKNNNFDGLQLIIENSPLVMFDDIGCIPLKDYDLLILSTLIEGRLLRGLSSIFTTNLQDEALKEVLGDRLYDRISRLSHVITFKADSLRGSDDK